MTIRQLTILVNIGTLLEQYIPGSKVAEQNFYRREDEAFALFSAVISVGYTQPGVKGPLLRVHSLDEIMKKNEQFLERVQAIRNLRGGR